MWNPLALGSVEVGVFLRLLSTIAIRTRRRHDSARLRTCDDLALVETATLELFRYLVLDLFRAHDVADVDFKLFCKFGNALHVRLGLAAFGVDYQATFWKFKVGK